MSKQAVEHHIQAAEHHEAATHHAYAEHRTTEAAKAHDDDHEHE